MDNAPHVLLVNPWIHDFAAYDFWARPYGLLSLGAVLRDHGVRVSFVDCLDRRHPAAKGGDPRSRHGRGPYLKTPIAKPAVLARIPRTYSRYGIRPEWLQADLAALDPPPDLILVTSMMTYWYPGVFETIAMLRRCLPGVPLVLGGIYARLCADHARAFSGADAVVTDTGRTLWTLVREYTGWDVTPRYAPDDWLAAPPPAFDLQRRISYIPLLTTRGCPFRCAYCASGFLEPRMQRHPYRQVVAQIERWHRQYGVVDFAFYDDALLVDAAHHALPLLEAMVRSALPLRFHTPNALHIRAIDAETAALMFRAGFHTIRLGLETTAFDDRAELDTKVTEQEFRQAVANLKQAGFQPGSIGAYLLVGLPGQTVAAVEQAMAVVKAAGVVPVPAHYTPIPHTALWSAAVAASPYDLAADPLLTNNAIAPCSPEGFSWDTLTRLKRLASPAGSFKF